jgi:N-formylglutamate deformylase
VSPSRKTELGIGLVWRLMDGKPIYDRRLGAAEVQGRIDRCWRPYHAALDAALGQAAAQHAAALAPERALDARRGLPQARPAREAAGRLRARQPRRQHLRRGHHGVVEDALRSAGYSVARNDPFKGVEIIRASGQPARGWHSLQIEVKRSLLHGPQLNKNAGFDRLQRTIDGLLAALAAHVRRQLA